MGPRAFGLDAHKDSISVAVAAAGREGEIRSFGTIQNSPEAVSKLVRRLAERHGTVEYAYEAGPCGYGVYRTISSLGANCRVVAPSRIPMGHCRSYLWAVPALTWVAGACNPQRVLRVAAG